MNYLRLEQRRFQSRLKVVYEIQATGFFILPCPSSPWWRTPSATASLQKDEGGVLTIRAWEGRRTFSRR